MQIEFKYKYKLGVEYDFSDIKLNNDFLPDGWGVY